MKRLYSTLEPTKQALNHILTKFDAPISYCFGYGSGVFSQGLNQRKRNTQIDLIFGVDNSARWHEMNIAQHPNHYSGLKYLGGSAISQVQRKLGAGVYFNPFCEIDGVKVKYGVVEIEDLQRDLENWDTLYLAGRLHKPVQILRDNPQVAASQRNNLIAATAVALMLLPNNFSEKELYMKIAGVSYMGDVRMALAENPNKVRNIVENQFHLFRKLYGPIIKELPVSGGSWDEKDSPLCSSAAVGPEAKGVAFEQGDDFEVLLGHLPENFRKRIGDSGTRIKTRVRAAVLSTVKKTSFTQSLKGILSAGIGRSFIYSMEKLKKRWG